MRSPAPSRASSSTCARSGAASKRLDAVARRHPPAAAPAERRAARSPMSRYSRAPRSVGGIRRRPATARSVGASTPAAPAQQGERRRPAPPRRRQRLGGKIDDQAEASRRRDRREPTEAARHAAAPPPSATCRAIDTRSPVSFGHLRASWLRSGFRRIPACTSRRRCHIAIMPRTSDGIVRAILGPTNTGKTHLAIERMCAHSSGVIGFPLRLLAREVYDRVVAIKGAAKVALITGEERILPQGAQYFLTTAETMPVPNGARAGRGRARLRLRRDRRGPARHRPRARPRLHRPPAARPRPRGDADPRLGHASPADPPIAARGRDRPPPALFDLALSGCGQARAAPTAKRDRRFLGRAGLRAGRDAAPLQGRRGGGHGLAQPGHPQRPGGHVPARRGRLSRRHRRHRHGPQHGRHPRRLRRLATSSTAAATAA